MPEYNIPESEIRDRQFEQLKLLFEYTKFHIGLYSTIIALIVGGIRFKVFILEKACVASFIVIALFFLVFAGFAGGVIAGNIPTYSSIVKFRKTKIGPKKYWTGEQWEEIEHVVFWVGVFFIFLALITSV